MTTDDHITALEAALAAMDGVAGPWYEARELLRGVIRVGPDADAAYIAAANPVAIRALLDEVKRLRDWIEFYCTCPCCERTQKCVNDCTFEHDDYAAAQRMSEARSVLYADAGGEQHG